MKKTNKILTAVAGLVAIGLSTFAQSPIAVQGHITANTKWFRTNQYRLVGCVYVDSDKTLTIESGTVIFGDTVANPTTGALIISRGAKIQAIGKINQPIVFTSPKVGNRRTAGDWGGIEIAGRAPVNKANAFLEGVLRVHKTQILQVIMFHLVELITLKIGRASCRERV